MTSVGKDEQKLEPSCTADKNVNGTTIWKIVWEFLKT